QTWAFIVGKAMTDPVWLFYLFWLPKFLDASFGVRLAGLAAPLVVIYVAADVGSVTGGWISVALIKRGWSVNLGRKTALLVAALAIVPTIFAPAAGRMWVAVSIVGVAAAAHQWWSANLFTTVSDMFPRHAVASVVGIGGFAGMFSAFAFQRLTGALLEATGGSYAPIFAVLGLAYVGALVFMHLLAPRLEPIGVPGEGPLAPGQSSSQFITVPMKITDIRATPVSVPLAAPLRHANGCHWGRFVRTIVEIETDNGLIGLGELGGGGESASAAVHGLKPYLVGRDPTQIEELRFVIANPTASLYNLRTQLLAAVEFACLDLLGQAWGVPVCTILGGRLRDHVPFASYLFFRYANAANGCGEVRTVDQLVAEARALKTELGFTTHQLKGGAFPPPYELECYRALAAALPGDSLRFDPNGVWS